MIYLDNAATSFPKPLAVRNEVMRCLTDYGGNPGRGAHALSMRAAEKVFECRERVASLFGVDEPERVIFTLNTTYALNLALKGLIREGDHVILSDLEHNAVWRPLYQWQEEGRITFSTFRSRAERSPASAVQITAEVAKALRPDSRLVVCTQASNICSVELPVREIAAFCHRHGLLCVVDGAQSAGHLPIRVDEWGIDVLCVPGHKGLLGPQGCGMLILGKGIGPECLLQGGNGVYSLEGWMTDQIPERYEVGTLPTPALAGLCEGIKTLERIGVETVSAYDRWLNRYATELLGNTKGVQLYAPGHEGAILLFSVDGLSSEHVGRRLNEAGICVRSGHHCAALAHQTLGTPEDGAVRASFGLTNRRGDVDVLWRTIRDMIRERT